jgi:hypothetical protein
MNPFAIADQPKVVSLGTGTVKQTRIPGQWDGNRSPVRQVNCQGVLAHSELGHLGMSITRQSIHANAAKVGPGVRKSTGK